MKRLVSVLCIVIIATYTGVTLNQAIKPKKINLPSIQLENTKAELNITTTKYRQVNDELDQIKVKSSSDKQKLKQLRAEKQKLLDQKKKLEKDLQAKTERKAKQQRELARASTRALNTLSGTKTAYAGSDHSEWLKMANIPQSDWQYVDYIVSHESGWRNDAVNPSSGSCGLLQQLPCGKWSHQWNDPVGALIDGTGYAKSRYGSWANAYSFWITNHYW